jgi:hypothetical protein
MRHSFLRLLALCLSLAPPCGQPATGAEQAQGAVIAVIDFGYSDTSGEPRDQRKEHETQLAAFMNGLRSDLGRAGSFRVVEPTCRPEPCSPSSTPLPNLLVAAQEAGADILLLGGVHKMSTLVQWAEVKAIDTKTGRIVLDKMKHGAGPKPLSRMSLRRLRSHSLLEGYDEPEILRSSSHQFCLTSAEAGQP